MLAEISEYYIQNMLLENPCRHFLQQLRIQDLYRMDFSKKKQKRLRLAWPALVQTVCRKLVRGTTFELPQCQHKPRNIKCVAVPIICFNSTYAIENNTK